jgi:transcriptional regulator EpsA
MNRVTESAELLAAPTNYSSSMQQADALIRVIETAVEVRRRHQFFVWAQSYLQSFVPHQLAICGAYQRTRRDILFEAFNSVPVPPSLLASMTDGGSTLMQHLIGLWIERRGRALVLDLHQMTGAGSGAESKGLIELGFDELLVHGVSRPQRPTELESLFIFSPVRRRSNEQQRVHLELLLPYVHATWLRVQATERDLGGGPAVVADTRSAAARGRITEREGQILFWVREGKSNQEIGDQLGISVLTVKNHVQKILRKLGAANRAQAVAKAMSLNLLGIAGREG